jgi:hypothetical protein
MGGGHAEAAPRKNALENKEAHDYNHGGHDQEYFTHDAWDMRTPFGPFAWMKYWVLNTAIGTGILLFACA